MAVQSSEDDGTINITPLPPSQLPLLIGSYNEVITELETREDRLTSACAMHELGDLHFHNSNKRSVYKKYDTGKKVTEKSVSARDRTGDLVRVRHT